MRLGSVFSLLAMVFVAHQAFADDSPDESIEDSTAAGEACLRTSHGTFVRGRNPQPDYAYQWVLEVVDHCDVALRWHIEYYNKQACHVLIWEWCSTIS